MQYESVVFRRAELYEQVWAEPLRSIAKRAGLSDVALAKICRKLGIPLPGRGYWARKQAGQEVGREPLPPLPEDKSAEVSVTRRRPVDALPPDTHVRMARERNSEEAIVVESVLVSEPHPLVARAAVLLGRRKPVEGVVSCKSERCLSVAVSPALLDRALRIMDALLKALEARGMQVEVTDPHERDEHGYSRPQRDKPPPNETRVLVGEAWISFRLSEISEPKPPAQVELKPGNRPRTGWRSWNAPERVPSSRLLLSITPPLPDCGRCFWRDGRRQRIESCLNAFVAEFYRKAELVRQAKVEAERLHRKWEAERLQRAEAERRAREEAAHVKRLEDWMSRWRSAHDLREFVAEARALVAAVDREITDDGELGTELRWIEAYADSIDPLRGLREQMVRSLADRIQAQAGDPRA